MQPIKKNKTYKDKLSEEVEVIMNHINNTVIKQYPSPKITVPMFFLAATELEYSLLYKTLNNFLTALEIEDIHDFLSETVAGESLSGLQLGTKPQVSTELSTLFSNTITDIEEFGYPLITSDVVLYAFIRTAKKSDGLRKKFQDRGITCENLMNLIVKTHASINTVTSIDLGSKEDDKTVKIILDLTGETPEIIQSETLENALDELANEMSKEEPVKEQSNNRNSLQFCTNLNDLAETGKLEPVIGRKEEINKIAKIFARKKSNNVILVGESGVGKTAIVEGLASMIVKGTAPKFLSHCVIQKLNIGDIMGGTQYRGAFEDRLNSIIKGLKANKDTILFIDDFHNIVNRDNQSQFDFTGMLSEIFNNSYTKVIATTTPKRYHTSIEGSPEVERKFQRINIDPLSKEETTDIIKGIKKNYETFHNVTYSEEAITSIAEMAQRYITDRALPSSAIDILDEAGAAKHVESEDTELIGQKKEEIAEYKRLMSEDILNMTQERIDEYTEKIDEARFEIAKASSEAVSKKAIVEIEDIYKAISEHTGIPVNKVNASEKKAISNIDKVLKADIIGQDEAIDVVSRAIKRSKVGLNPATRPIFSCMCIGSTGVGKTLLAKKLATEIFGSEKYLIRIDMSEYSDKTAVNKLIGSSAGYVGYTEGGILTEKVKNQKYAVILIDEVEKATDEIFNLFLQILDEGYLNDNTGQKVDFKNTVLMLTSNVGTKRAQQENGIGFEVDDNANKRSIIEKELKKKFSPEFINRLDEIVYFNSLDESSLRKIIELEMGKLTQRLWKQKYDLIYKDNAIDYILELAKKEKEYGARPILKIIRQEIENKVTDIILSHENQTQFKICVNDNKMEIQ